MSNILSVQMCFSVIRLSVVNEYISKGCFPDHWERHSCILKLVRGWEKICIYLKGAKKNVQLQILQSKCSKDGQRPRVRKKLVSSSIKLKEKLRPCWSTIWFHSYKFKKGLEVGIVVPFGQEVYKENLWGAGYTLFLVLGDCFMNVLTLGQYSVYI